MKRKLYRLIIWLLSESTSDKFSYAVLAATGIFFLSLLIKGLIG